VHVAEMELKAAIKDLERKKVEAKMIWKLSSMGGKEAKFPYFLETRINKSMTSTC